MADSTFDLIASLPEPVNAWGTPTRYGVSRSSAAVAAATGAALRTHVDMEQLQRHAALAVSQLSGAAGACFCHCASAALVLAVAASLSRDDVEVAHRLPRHDEVGVTAIQAEHCVNYGQPIVQTLRLAGSHVRILEGPADARIEELKLLTVSGRLRAVVHVESLLAQSAAPIGHAEMAALARELDATFIVDAAAKDWRLGDQEFVRGADLAIFSGQKYLAAPTCGILVGTQEAIAACGLNLQGIGRPMKPTKEALSGLMAAIAERNWAGLPALRLENLARARRFAQALEGQTGLATQVPDGPEYGPYPRVLLRCRSADAAQRLTQTLLQLPKPIVLGGSRLKQGIATVELTHVNDDEEAYLLREIRCALSA